MAITTAALVDAGDVVVNRIAYDPAADFTPPDGQAVVEETAATGTAWIGLGWDGTVFEQPPPNPEPPPPEPGPELEPLPARIDKLENQMAEILELLKKKSK